MVLLFINGRNNRWALTLRDTKSGKVRTEYGYRELGDIALHQFAISVAQNLLKYPVELQIIGRVPLDIPNYSVNENTPEMQHLEYLCC